jgi:hypothetical protein
MMFVQDYFGTVGSAVALVNNLNVKLSNLTHTFHPLTTTPSRPTDNLNNLEVIILHNPSPNSTYTVTISATSLSIAQPYSLVISGEVNAHLGQDDGDEGGTPSSTSDPVSAISNNTVLAIALMAILASLVVSLVYYLVGRKETDIESKYGSRASHTRSKTDRHSLLGEIDHQSRHSKSARRSIKSRTSDSSRSLGYADMYPHASYRESRANPLAAAAVAGGGGAASRRTISSSKLTIQQHMMRQQLQLQEQEQEQQHPPPYSDPPSYPPQLQIPHTRPSYGQQRQTERKSERRSSARQQNRETDLRVSFQSNIYPQHHDM